MAPPKKKTVESDQGPSLEGMDPQVKADMERALAAAQSRLNAPAVRVTARENPLKDFIAQFAPETTGRDAKWHAYTDAPKYHSRNLEKGYIPVLDPTTKRQAVTPEGDLLYKLPMELYRRNLAQVKARSDAILRKTAKEEHGVKRDEHGEYGVVEEKVSIATGSSIEEAEAIAEEEMAAAG